MENCLISLKVALPKNKKVGKPPKYQLNRLNRVLKNYRQNIILEKNRKKIKNDDFVVCLRSEYNKILTINYNCKQLKKICEHYHIPKTGNKNILTRRIYTTLKLSYFIINIQKYFRGFLVRNFIKLSGPALFNRSLCVNKTDFLTLGNINTIRVDNFISFKDKDNFIYGFELNSVYKLILSSKKNKQNYILKNPYNRKKLSLQTIKSILKKIKIAKILYVCPEKHPINLDRIIGTKQQLKFKVLDVFHKFDTYGHTTNADWFLSLTKFQLMRYMRELKDIWFHRLDLTNDTRKRIYPPNGNPFLNYHRSYIIQKNILFIQNCTIQLIENMITKGISNEYRTLGIFYVLTALTLVSQPAATALPWLYDSVHLVNNQIMLPH